MHSHFMPLMSTTQQIDGLLNLLHRPLARWIDRHLDYTLSVLRECRTRRICDGHHVVSIELLGQLEAAFQALQTWGREPLTRAELRTLARDLRRLERSHHQALTALIESLSWHHVFDEMFDGSAAPR